MTTQKILLCLAHPDDEILGPGGTIAQYAQNGAYVELVCATRGEAGEIADPALATPETLAEVREQELRCAAETLGIQQVTFLNYRDSGMAGTADNQRPDAFINALADEVVAQLVAVMRRVRPQVVITFEPYGGYGHPDHIAIHHHTHTAFEKAGDTSYRGDLGRPYHPQRLFYPLVRFAFFQAMKEKMEQYGLETDFFTNLEERRDKGWPDDKFNVVIDISRTINRKMTAFACHRTQFGPDNLFRRLPETEMAQLLQSEYFALAWPESANSLQLNNLFDGLS
ncbi:MAG: PIG-L family deacetylase [Ardenticatenaceae bacterium]|nr:PIG-L family deacetylase [Ardenticatenaceae bacterium]MCB9442615.1 PIG-L family deacetylase [Ardenticatenaceae bacterium]